MAMKKLARTQSNNDKTFVIFQQSTRKEAGNQTLRKIAPAGLTNTDITLQYLIAVKSIGPPSDTTALSHRSQTPPPVAPPRLAPPPRASAPGVKRPRCERPAAGFVRVVVS